MNDLPTGVDDEMQNKILVKRKTLQSSIELLSYKIENLRIYYSKEQVRCWRVNRYNLKQELAKLPTEEQIQKNAKRINYSNSTKFDK